jgi:phosphoglycolate phosphatase-like HAD superfamily hydrolase
LNVIGFDLDMTLVNSSEAIVFSAISAIRSFAPQANIDEMEIRREIGLPIKDLITRYVGSLNSNAAYENYKKYYVNEGLDLSSEIDGAKSTILQLQLKGYSTCVITAKDQNVAELQLRHLGFPFIKVFGNSFGSEKTRAMLAFECTHYVGDHYHDYLAAVEAHIAFIGVDSNPEHDLRGRLPSDVLVIEKLSQIDSALNRRSGS